MKQPDEFQKAAGQAAVVYAGGLLAVIVVFLGLGLLNLNTDDFARVQARMKELSPIATIEH